MTQKMFALVINGRIDIVFASETEARFHRADTGIKYELIACEVNLVGSPQKRKNHVVRPGKEIR